MLLTNDEIRQLCLDLSEILRRRGWRLGTAESCTGGWLAKVCTDQPGSSDWFAGGIVSYTNAVKTAVLQVDADALSQFGAVSSEVAEAMTKGALQALPNADVVVAVTGLAGPGGATSDKPLGLVWIACQSRGQEAVSRRFEFKGDRDAVRRQAAVAGLQSLKDYLHSAFSAFICG